MNSIESVSKSVRSLKSSTGPAAVTAAIAEQVKGLPYADRPLALMRASLTLEALAGESAMAADAAAEDGKARTSERFRLEQLVYEAASRLVLKAHDKTAGVTRWYQSSTSARRRSRHELAARGLLDYQGEVIGRALTPVVERLDRLSSAVEKLAAGQRRRPKRVVRAA